MQFYCIFRLLLVLAFNLLLALVPVLILVSDNIWSRCWSRFWTKAGPDAVICLIPALVPVPILVSDIIWSRSWSWFWTKAGPGAVICLILALVLVKKCGPVTQWWLTKSNFPGSCSHQLLPPFFPYLWHSRCLLYLVQGPPDCRHLETRPLTARPPGQCTVHLGQTSTVGGVVCNVPSGIFFSEFLVDVPNFKRWVCPFNRVYSENLVCKDVQFVCFCNFIFSIFGNQQITWRFCNRDCVAM